MTQTDMLTTVVLLVRECFEGREPGRNYTWFVEGREGIFDALDSICAEKASLSPGSGVQSIAAHAFHILFALRGANAAHGGSEPEGDWEDSWSRHTVSEPEWNELLASIRAQYTSFMRWLRNQQDWEDASTLVGAVAVLPHMAFHLGAIRQLMRVSFD